MKITPIPLININFNTPSSVTPAKTTAVFSKKLRPLKYDTVSFGAGRKERNYETVLTNIPLLPCACCGRIVIPENVFDRPLLKNYDVPAYDVLRVLKKYEPRMQKTERAVFRRLEKLGKKYPDLNLHDLFIRKRYYHLANTEIKQLKVLSAIENTDLNISEDSQEKLDKALKNARQIMFLEEKNVKGKRRRMIKEFLELMDSCPEKEEISKIVSIIQHLPSSSNDMDSFFVKYANADSETIAKKLLESAKASIEHVRASSESGADHASNFIVMCRKCNNDRGSIPYSEFIKENPAMVKNSQKYIDRVISYLNRKYIFGFENYPYQIQKQLFEETDGVINLDISKYRKPFVPPKISSQW